MVDSKGRILESSGDASSEWDCSITPGGEVGLDSGNAGEDVVESAAGDAFARKANVALAVWR